MCAFSVLCVSVCNALFVLFVCFHSTNAKTKKTYQTFVSVMRLMRTIVHSALFVMCLEC